MAAPSAPRWGGTEDGLAMRIFVTAVVLATGVLGACGESETDDTGECSRTFCAALLDLDAAGTDDGQAFLDGTAALDDAAPDEISGSTAEIREHFETIVELGALDADEQAESIERLTGSENAFNDAVAALQAYASDNCPDAGDALFGAES